MAGLSLKKTKENISSARSHSLAELCLQHGHVFAAHVHFNTATTDMRHQGKNGSVAKFEISLRLSMLQGMTQRAKQPSWISRAARLSGTSSFGVCVGR